MKIGGVLVRTIGVEGGETIIAAAGECVQRCRKISGTAGQRIGVVEGGGMEISHAGEDVGEGAAGEVGADKDEGAGVTPAEGLTDFKHAQR